MFKKWQQRHNIRKQWDDVLLRILRCGPATSPPDASTLRSLHECFNTTIATYAVGNRVNKRTLRAIYALKRVLADKRMYDHIKMIEYLLFGHTYTKKRLVSREVKEAVLAHCLQMAQAYLDLLGKEKPSNPFAPGQAIEDSTQ